MNEILLYSDHRHVSANGHLQGGKCNNISIFIVRLDHFTVKILLNGAD